MKLRMKAPAKINLSLDVLYKRPDGFHEVDMIMTQIDLADRLTLSESASKQIELHSSSGFIPTDQKNLAVQAAKLMQETYNVRAGVRIHIEKRIPVAAGLAGGSSDAAAVLRGLNELWELERPTEELAQLGSHIGSDVAYCVYGGTARATGRGEIIEPISAPPPAWVIIAKPPLGVSTGEVYKRMKPNNTSVSASATMQDAIAVKDYAKMCSTLHNDLEAVTLEMYPEVGRIKERMIQSGVDAALMSGSGPTVFGLVAKEAKLSRVYNGLRGFCEDVHAVRLLHTNNS
ncbi:4-(cytidine 5'-diphospho)-2-C-methyl-D-erythritol kinase [Salsuginibacillus kocurii]|uniref:4-(cytidine 5'-diphospho)-2-C-methyl-D-erythritol kinase n=1 Tax=Salsuginibacillus kocurii TaxID=427078 RepID=UPI0003729EBD|nr:4-(cytidine 5'-diphospho)-2-C-methyl-D-erythritol kinase [Salsuginibacillus kocurii]